MACFANIGGLELGTLARSAIRARHCPKGLEGLSQGSVESKLYREENESQIRFKNSAMPKSTTRTKMGRMFATGSRHVSQAPLLRQGLVVRLLTARVGDSASRERSICNRSYIVADATRTTSSLFGGTARLFRIGTFCLPVD
jgi:hypothetical protein